MVVSLRGPRVSHQVPPLWVARRIVQWGQDELEKKKGNLNWGQREAILVDVSINERRMGRLNQNTWWQSGIEYAPTNPRLGLPNAGDCMSGENEIQIIGPIQPCSQSLLNPF